jgi:hypothetical protein
MRLKKGLAAAIVAAFVMLPFCAVAAQAQKGLEIGIEDDFVLTGAYYSPSKLLNTAEKLKTAYARVLVSWADVREIGGNARSRRVPKHRRYDFRLYDGIWIRASQQRHILLQFTLTGPFPAWASATHRKSAIPNRKAYKYFKEFASQLAAHFKGRVGRYGIWNEPNFVSWLGPQRNAESEYRKLYQAGYSAIKAQDPTAEVLIGETSPYAERGRAIAPLTFLAGVLGHGRYHLKADGYAHHPYDFNHSPTYRYPGGANVTIGTLGRLRNALVHWANAGALTTPQGGVPDEFLTEYGYLSSGKLRIKDRKHAQYLVKSFQIALNTPHVRELVPYTMVPPRGRYKFFDMSILTPRGKPRPPFTALAKWAQNAARQGLITVLY